MSLRRTLSISWGLLGLSMIIGVCFPPLLILAFFVAIECLCLSFCVGGLYLAVLFFMYTRYSLRTMLLAVWALGLVVAMLTSGSHVLAILGYMVLFTLLLALSHGIQQFDPTRKGPPAGGILAGVIFKKPASNALSEQVPKEGPVHGKSNAGRPLG